VLIVCIKIGKKTIKGYPNKKFIGRSQQWDVGFVSKLDFLYP
jgi:hypothetical protein